MFVYNFSDITKVTKGARCMSLLGRPRTYAPDRPATGAERQARWRERRRQTPPPRRKVYHRSQTDEHATPQEFYDALHAEFGFTLDPCATRQNAKCSRFFTQEQDGLSQDWTQDRFFMNPPFK